jgi:hypothetical protein
MEWWEIFLDTVRRLLTAAGYPEVGIIAVILVLAVVVAFLKYIGWHPPKPSPDLVENPPSPPIPLNPDGSIPTGNPVTPPDPLP